MTNKEVLPAINIKCYCCDKEIEKNAIYVGTAKEIFCNEDCIVRFIAKAKDRENELKHDKMLCGMEIRELNYHNEQLEKRIQELMTERKLIRRMLK